ncbi:MAG TPA: hypothetical protein VLJ62_15960, partial [Burkholderiaceae bacterium]|nr:hypothetical protein [Burkholderiaceae bacterium]
MHSGAGFAGAIAGRGGGAARRGSAAALRVALAARGGAFGVVARPEPAAPGVLGSRAGTTIASVVSTRTSADEGAAAGTANARVIAVVVAGEAASVGTVTAAGASASGARTPGCGRDHSAAAISSTAAPPNPISTGVRAIHAGNGGS